MYPVRDIGDPAGIPYLIRALDDPEYEVHYWAVNRLAEVSGQMDRWIETGALKEDEAKHINYWKRWWAEGGARKILKTKNPPPTVPAKPAGDE